MKKRTKILLAITIPLLVLGSAFAAFPLANVIINANFTIYRPTCEKMDLTSLIAKKEKTEEDYAILEEQTGLTKLGIDDRIADGKANRIKQEQEDFFTTRTVEHTDIGFLLCEERSDVNHPLPYLKAGDIILDPDTHFGFFKCGHCGIALSDNPGSVFALCGYDYTSGYESLYDYMPRASYVILRPKCGKEKIQQIIQFIRDNLFGISYEVFAGVFGPAEQHSITNSNCCHIIWYAFYQFGIDLDSGHDRVLFASDIMHSDELELVQAVGMDPATVK